MPNPVTIPLDPPVAHAGGTIAALTLREPSAAAVMECDRKHPRAEGTAEFRAYRLAQVALATGLTVDALCSLPVSAFNRAAASVGTMLDFGVTLPEPPPALEIALDPPVVSGGVTYGDLQLREPTTGQMWAAERGLNGGSDAAALRNYQIVLVAQVSGKPYAAVGDMPVSVVSRAAAYCLGFSEPGRTTGGS